MMISSCNSKSRVEAPTDSYETETQAQFPLSPIKSQYIYDIACGTNFTVGRHMSGDLVFTGNCSKVYKQLDSLRDCVSFVAGNSAAAGINPNGTVTVISKSNYLYQQAENWTAIVSLAFGNDFLVGLRVDGSVVACGKNTFGQCDTLDIEGAVAIAAGGSNMAALLWDGTVVTKGLFSPIDTTESWTNLQSIAATETGIIGVKTDGSVLTFNCDQAAYWKNLQSVYAGSNVVVGIQKDGSLISTKSNKKISKLKHVYKVTCGYDFICILFNDGTVKGYGNNEQMQYSTELWDLGITKTSDGYLTGFAPNTNLKTAKKLLEADFGANITFHSESNAKTTVDESAANGENLTGDSASSAGDSTSGIGDFANGNELVNTGMYVRLNGKELGRVLIYGDCNGDGAITEADMQAIDKHIAGKNSANGSSVEENSADVLQGIYLAAADTTHYMSGTQTASLQAKNRIAAHLNGTAQIKQYIHDPYKTALLKMYEINNDVVGYVRLHDTNIDYPVLYGGPYYYYHYNNIYKRASELGAIYSIHGGSKKHNIIVGHNGRVSKIMFNQLHRIQDNKKKLYTYSNRVYGVTLYDEYSLWEIYALYETPRYEPLSTQVNNIQPMDSWTDKEINKWIQGQISRSEIQLNTDVDSTDTLLTMYTCGDRYYNGDPQSRLYIFFRKVG